MHAISSYRGNRLAKPQTYKQTDRTDYNTLRRYLVRSVINVTHSTIVLRLGRGRVIPRQIGKFYPAFVKQ